MSSGRVVARAVVLGVLVVGALLPAVPASAHAVLERTDPPSGLTIPKAPRTVSLVFNEAVNPVAGQIHVVAPDRSQADKEVKPDGVTIGITLRDGLPKGTYLVNYRVISADSHPIAGAFTFSVGAPSEQPPAVAEPRTDPVVAVALPAARYLGFAGLLLVVGPTVFLVSLWPRRLSRQWPGRLVWTGFGLLVAGTLAALYLQAPYTTGSRPWSVSVSDLAAVLGSRYGAAHLTRFGALMAALPLLYLVIRGRTGRADKILLGLLGAVAVLTWPLSGHPSASSVPPLTVLTDASHIGAMAVWLGGLVVLARYLLPSGRVAELGAILPVWSRWAMVAVGVLVVGGTAGALVEVGTPAALFGTTYGWLIVTKVVLLAALVSAASVARGLVNRRAAPAPAEGDGAWNGTTPDDEPPDAVPPEDEAPAAETPEDDAPPDEEAQQEDEEEDEEDGAADPGEGAPIVAAAEPRRLRRVVLVELVLAALVLGVSSVLVQTPPARTVADAPAALPGQFSALVAGKKVQIQIDVTPAEVGENTLHLYAFSQDGKPIVVEEWTGSVSLASAGVENLSIQLLALTDDHATGLVTLPAAGVWEFSITVRTSPIDSETVRQTVPVK